MSQIKKEELTSLQEIVGMSQKLKLELAELVLQEEELVKSKKNLLLQINKSAKNLKLELEKIEELYGNININLQTGEYTEEVS